MVISVFAGTLALSGAAVGATQSLSSASAPNAPANTDDVTHTVTFDVTIDGNTQDQIRLNYSDISGVSPQSVSASSGSSSDVNVTNTQTNSGDAQVAIKDQTADGAHTVTITVDTTVDVSSDPKSGVTLDIVSSNSASSTSDTFDIKTSSGSYDEALVEGNRFWSGQTLYNDSFSPNENNIELQRDTSDGWEFVTEVDVNGAGEVLLDSSDRQTDTYRLVDASNTAQNITFDLSEQEYSASADPGTVNNAGENTNSEITVTSNRNGYTHLISSPQLTPAEINASIGGIGTLVDSDGDGENEFVSVPGTTEDKLDTDFSGLDTGNYTLDFVVADTGVTASTTVEVDQGATGNVEFNKSVFNEEQGDVATIVVNMENGAESAEITIGNQDVNYVTNATVTDEDGDGKVTLLWNTSTAAVPNDGMGASDTLQVEGEDSISGASLETSEFDSSSSRLGATEYPVSAEFNGDETSVSVVSLTSPEQVERNAASWTAPGSTDASDVLGEIAQDSSVAEDDWLVLQFETAGIYGSVYDSSDLNVSDPTEGVFVRIQETDDSTGVNEDPKSLNASDFTLVRDEANNEFYLIAKESNLNTEAGEEYRAALVVDGDGRNNPYTDERKAVATTFSVAETSASIDAPEDSRLEVEGSSNATVTGTSTFAEGTDLTIRVRNDGGENPFLQQETVTTMEDGDWSAEFDLSEIPEGTNFTVSVSMSSNQLDSADATVVAEASPSLEVTNIDSPDTAAPGETITVTATVENSGSAEGTQNVSFVFDGETVATEEVTVSAGSSQDVSFEATAPEDTGDYTHGVQVGDNAVVEETLTVESDDGTTTTTTTTTTEETTTAPSDDDGEPTTSEPSDDDGTTTTSSEGQPGFGVAVALVALVAAALLAVRRDN